MALRNIPELPLDIDSDFDLTPAPGRRPAWRIWPITGILVALSAAAAVVVWTGQAVWFAPGCFVASGIALTTRWSTGPDGGPVEQSGRPDARRWSDLDWYVHRLARVRSRVWLLAGLVVLGTLAVGLVALALADRSGGGS